ncbi:MAG: response regulator [Paraburkholderia sp.]|uniref:hybrid sensor histidine kinase/response regulator n=1 Tax=Paraburkholderia sp. TaxID=1926495 RepID=UPI00121118C2|nr:ATP-binding protein [Paraburkholderia sp.]TAM00377.1 MAG: response regulator [Paraburkholderia sp.]
MIEPSESPVISRVRRAGALITAELAGRPRRSPDFAAENSALHRLAQAVAEADTTVLQVLSDIALMLCNAGSAGISLLENGGDHEPAFCWTALSGRCAEFVGRVIPREDSPSGVTLALGAAQLFAVPQRHFACLGNAIPQIVEELVVPIPGTPGPWGALWVMSHDAEHRFDAEHGRILGSLANFTCAALAITRTRAVAEARAAEAEAARDALAAAEAHKDEFIATLGHELRNPIGPIDSALAAARPLTGDNPPVLSALAVAERQVRQLKRLVSDLLDASRIRHGKLSVRPSYSQLADIVKDALAAVRVDVDRRGQQLRTILPPYPVTVFADHARLTQVLSNVLSNAVKYTPAGGMITLSVEAPDPATIPVHDSTPREVVITVRDTGVGIAPILLPHVFEMFTQSAAVGKRAEGGLGIGLTVVKYLVNAHNGHIAIESQGPGEGTEVTIRLPIVCRSTTASAVAASPVTLPARILLVDDNVDATEALSMLLALEGHEVKRALSGPEALSIVDSFTPDVALIDISMPGMDGHELARLIREREQCALTRLVALTGYTDAVGSPEAEDGGFDFHLVKPLSLEDLADVLRSPPSDPIR